MKANQRLKIAKYLSFCTNIVMLYITQYSSISPDEMYKKYFDLIYHKDLLAFYSKINARKCSSYSFEISRMNKFIILIKTILLEFSILSKMHF